MAVTPRLGTVALAPVDRIVDERSELVRQLVAGAQLGEQGQHAVAALLGLARVVEHLAAAVEQRAGEVDVGV